MNRSDDVAILGLDCYTVARSSRSGFDDWSRTVDSHTLAYSSPSGLDSAYRSEMENHHVLGYLVIANQFTNDLTSRPGGFRTGFGKIDEMARTVLIVEDSDTSADTLEIALLSLPGVSVEHVRSGRNAWLLLQKEPVSAIITDLHMPHMDGFELIERVRAAPPDAYVPIIVVSGDSDPDTPDRVRRLGADAYFAKPYSPAAVRDTLERLLHENFSPSP